MSEYRKTEIDSTGKRYGHDDNTTEVGRLETFVGWPMSPSIPNPISLCHIGFYYTGELDKVKCCDCLMTIKDWKTKQHPLIEHYKLNKRCIFVQKNDELISINNIELFNPAEPFYSSSRNRTKSFIGSLFASSQSVESLSNAGFYYIGPAGQVKCFYCGIILDEWEWCDIPLGEHSIWSPDCLYLKLCISSLGDLSRITQSELHQTDPRSLSCISPAIQKTLKEEENVCLHNSLNNTDILSNILTSSKVEAVAQLFPKFRVEQIVKNHFKKHHKDFSTVEELCEAVMNSETSEDVEKVTTDEKYSEKDECCSNDETRIVLECLGSTANDVEKQLKETVSYNMEKPFDKNQKDEGYASVNSHNEVLCKICLDAEVKITFVPCGHLATCERCASSLTECPICRAPINNSIKTFLS